MKLELKITKEFDVRFLVAKVPVRYWVDQILNGSECIDGDKFPCNNDGLWQPRIDIDSGKITNWVDGNTAEIHIKVVDEGTYILQDDDFNDITKIEEDYVPKMMCPKESGYGDYIIMDILEDGTIKDFKPNFDDFIFG